MKFTHHQGRIRSAFIVISIAMMALFPTSAWSAAGDLNHSLLPQSQALAHPVEAGCRRALGRIGLKYVSATGAMGGCTCLAQRFDQDVEPELHKPALEAFVLAVLARNTADADRPQIYKRFNALQARHNLSSETFGAIIGKMANVVNSCG